MRQQITTTLESELLKKARIEAINLQKAFNDILEEALILYFENKKQIKL